MGKGEIRAFLETQSDAYIKAMIPYGRTWSKEWRQMAYGIRLEHRQRRRR